jgi:hypothetical protein
MEEEHETKEHEASEHCPFKNAFEKAGLKEDGELKLIRGFLHR